MLFDIVTCAVSIILFFIAKRCKKSLLSFLTCILTVFSASSILLNCFLSVKYVTNIRIYVYSFLITFIALVIFNYIQYRSVKVFFSVIILIISIGVCAVTVAFVGVKYKTCNEKNYVGIYENITGIGETVVTYYEVKMLIFMSSEYSFTENYGILLCGSDEIFDNEPYKIEYNPNFQVNGSGANE